MEQQPQANKIPTGRRRIVLPFEKRKTDPGSWAYEHRVGICVTVIAYLLFGIVFISSKIVISHKTYVTGILVDFDDPEEVQPREMTPEERAAMQDDFRSAINRVSDENASQTSDGSTSTSFRDANIEAQQQAIADRLNAGRETYEQGLQREQEILNSRNQSTMSPSTSAENRSVKIAGTVQISFNLEGRHFVYEHNPAYQCEGGGQVVVSIAVNRNGNVTSANAVKSSSTSDGCLTEMAELAARRSRFNTSADAPESQKGTITYVFIPQ